MAKPSPHIIKQANGSEKEVSQFVFQQLLATGLLVKVRRKLALIREGYYCFSDHSANGEIRIAALAGVMTASISGSGHQDNDKYLPPFPAQIDIAYLVRERQMSRTEILEFVGQARVGALYKAADKALNLR